jgi:hypothetical protein
MDKMQLRKHAHPALQGCDVMAGFDLTTGRYGGSAACAAWQSGSSHAQLVLRCLPHNRQRKAPLP